MYVMINPGGLVRGRLEEVETFNRNGRFKMAELSKLLDEDREFCDVSGCENLSDFTVSIGNYNSGEEVSTIFCAEHTNKCVSEILNEIGLERS